MVFLMARPAKVSGSRFPQCSNFRKGFGMSSFAPRTPCLA